VERLFSVVGLRSPTGESLKAPRRWPTSTSLSSIFLLQNAGGGAHVNDVWLFVIQHLRVSCYAIGY